MGLVTCRFVDKIQIDARTKCLATPVVFPLLIYIYKLICMVFYNASRAFGENAKANFSKELSRSLVPEMFYQRSRIINGIISAKTYHLFGMANVRENFGAIAEGGVFPCRR